MFGNMTADMPQAEMPRYRCHKEVHALKIAAILHDQFGAVVSTDTGPPFRVDPAYVEKHKPQVGGYYVVYADGYKSFSPAQAFEEGYTRI